MRIRLLTVLALIALPMALPATADAAKRKVPAKFYGTMWDKEIADAPPEVYDQQFAKMAVNGVEAARVIFSWNLAQEQQGQTTYRFTDPMVEYAARHGIEPLPVVTYAPPWARVEPNELGSAPSNYQAYADYLKLLIARYGPDGQFWKEKPGVPYRPVRIWQLWNEPGVQYQWSPQADWPRKYGELLKLGYTTVKQADPGAKVVMAGLANASWEEIAALYEQARSTATSTSRRSTTTRRPHRSSWRCRSASARRWTPTVVAASRSGGPRREARPARGGSTRPATSTSRRPTRIWPGS